VKRLVRIAGSPLSKVHFIHILIRLNNNHPLYHRLARRVAMSLLNSEGLEDFDAFLILFKWIFEEFGHWPDAQRWPIPLRLAIIWAHSHRLFTIFNSVGLPAAEIFDVFEERWHKLPCEIFKRDPVYWHDISHPRHVNREGFLLTGLVYAFGDKIESIIDNKLQDLISPLVTLHINDTDMPAFGLLKDTMLAQNTLNSFLALARGEALFSFFGKESSKGFERKELLSLAKQAIDRLSNSIDQPSDWAIIHAIVGDFPLPENLSKRLIQVLQKTNFVSLIEKDPLAGGIAIQMASSQSINFKNENLCNYIKDQLIGIAKLFAGKPPDDSTNNPKVEIFNDTKTICMILLESALNLAQTAQSKGSIPEEFGNIIKPIVEAWRLAVYEYRPIIERLCEELPSNEARDLWPTLIRLRAD
jgi:hypothetical protein